MYFLYSHPTAGLLVNLCELDGGETKDGWREPLERFDATWSISYKGQQHPLSFP